MLFSSDRRFRFWDYNVSHKQMLLRSPSSADVPENLDLVFWGVEYLDLPTVLDGLALVPASRAEIARVERMRGRNCDPTMVYCLVSDDRKFVVVAAGFKVLKNELDLFDSSLESFAGSLPTNDVGEVLSHS